MLPILPNECYIRLSMGCNRIIIAGVLALAFTGSFCVSVLADGGHEIPSLRESHDPGLQAAMENRIKRLTPEFYEG